MKKVLSFLFLICFSFFILGCAKTTISDTTLTQSTTEAPTTTEAPMSTTEVPQSTTEAPVSTTEAPMSTTEIDNGFVFDNEQYMEEFNERKAYLRQYIDDQFSNSFGDKYFHGVAAIWMEEYKKNQDPELFAKVKKQVMKALTDIKNLTAPDCGRIFWAVYFFGLYHDYYDEEMYDLAHEVITTTMCYGGKPSTTNHALQFAVACYLANQYFPGEVVTDYQGYDGSGPTSWDPDPDASKTIKGVLKAYPINGCFECNSDTYFGLHFFPLLCLARCSLDETVRQMALQCIENMIFNLAPIWLYGHMAVGKERCYDPYTTECLSGLTNTILWYYFGGRRDFPTYLELQKAEMHGCAMLLADDFMPNWISVMMANDRSETYTHKEVHVYTKDPYGYTMYEFCKSYINKDYGVYSMQTTYTKNEFVKHFRGYDRVLWGVDWVSEAGPHEKSNFSIMHWDAPVTDNHTAIGTSVYQDVLQNDGTVIGVFDIPEEYDSRFADYTYPQYVVINIPTNYIAIIDESYVGKMYIHYGNILIGFRLSTGFKYDGEDHTNTEKMTKGWFVCEIKPASEIEGEDPEEQLLYFQSLCESSFRTVEQDYTDRTKISYTSIDGVEMSLKYGGDGGPTEASLNGEPVVYSIQSWPSQSNPWIESKVGDREITYTYKGHSITFNFRNYTTIEE